MNGSKEVLAVTKRDLASAFMISSNALPDVSKHELLVLLGDWTDEAELEEKLRHLSATYFDFWVEVLGLLRNLNNLQLVASLLEVSVKSIMDHLVR